MNFKLESLSKINKTSYFQLSILIALYYALIINIPFYIKLYDILEKSNSMNIGLFLSMPIFIFAITNILFNLISWPYIAKPIFIFLIFFLLIINRLNMKLFVFQLFL